MHQELLLLELNKQYVELGESDENLKEVVAKIPLYKWLMSDNWERMCEFLLDWGIPTVSVVTLMETIDEIHQRYITEELKDTLIETLVVDSFVELIDYISDN